MNALSKVLIVIAIIGALNWGLIGFFNFNLVDAILGGGSAEQTSIASRVVYAFVGLCGLLALLLLPRLRDRDDLDRARTAGSRARAHGAPAATSP